MLIIFKELYLFFINTFNFVSKILLIQSYIYNLEILISRFKVILWFAIKIIQFLCILSFF